MHIKATKALFQTENKSLTVEFDTSRAIDEPKLQRLSNNGVGEIIFLRHLLPTDKDRATLCPPIDQPDGDKPHFNHRTLYVLEVDLEKLDNFEWVGFTVVYNFIN